jgi:hypothetical protein
MSVQRLALATGKTLHTSMSGGGMHTGTSSIMRETLTVFRELGRGNLTRIPGSLSILAQYLGIIKFLTKDTAIAEEIAAAAADKEADATLRAAYASAKKSQASMEVFYAAKGEATAEFELAAADEQLAMADLTVAKAAQAKAASMREAATVARAMAGPSKMAFSGAAVALGVIAALVAGLYAAKKISTALVGQLSPVLSTMSASDIERIPLREQKAGRRAEFERQVTYELQKQRELYLSSAKAAERLQELTAMRFEHSKKANDLDKDFEMARARTDYQRYQISEKYAQKDIDLETQRRNEIIQNKKNEMAQAAAEAQSKKSQALELGKTTPSKKDDEEALRVAKAKADAAQKYVDEYRKIHGSPAFGQNPGGSDNSAQFVGKVIGSLLTGDVNTAKMGYEAKRTANWAAVGTGVSTKEFDKAAEEKLKASEGQIKYYRDLVSTVNYRDVKRERIENLQKQGEDAAKVVGGISNELPHLLDVNKQAVEQMTDEMKRTLNVQLAEMISKPAIHGDVNSLQAVGAWAMKAQSNMIDINKAQLQQLTHIAQSIDKGSAGGNQGRTRY